MHIESFVIVLVINGFGDVLDNLLNNKMYRRDKYLIGLLDV